MRYYTGDEVKNMISWARHKWSLDESNMKELEGQNLFLFLFFYSQARHTREKWFPLQFTCVPACLVNLSGRYGEISLAEGLSSAGREPSISSSPPLNWRKYLPFTMCQLFLQCQRIRLGLRAGVCSSGTCMLASHLKLHFMPHFKHLQGKVPCVC